jgi:hypothetical protein
MSNFFIESMNALLMKKKTRRSHAKIKLTALGETFPKKGRSRETAYSFWRDQAPVLFSLETIINFDQMM